jgi:hypothetical protein
VEAFQQMKHKPVQAQRLYGDGNTATKIMGFFKEDGI